MSLEFDYPRDFKGIFIPKEIWLDDDLSAIEKIILSEIYSLDVEDSDGCYASNEYISNCFGLSKRSITRLLKELKDKEYIRIEYSKEHFRKIYTNIDIKSKKIDYEIFDYDWLNDDSIY